MHMIKQLLKRIYFRYFLKVKKGKCLFIPHIGICKNDLVSISNYKADNCPENFQRKGRGRYNRS